jgi:hypothetical protein
VPAEFTTRGIDATVEQAAADFRPGGFGSLYGSDFAHYRVRGAVRRRGVSRGSALPVALDGDDHDVVEVEYVDGQVRYERAATLAATARARGAGSGVARAVDGSEVGVAEVRRLDARLPADIAEAVEDLNQRLRGVDRDPIDRSVAATAIDVLAPFVIDPLAEKAAVKIAGWIEKPCRDDDPEEVMRKKPKRPGIYRVGRDLHVEPKERRDEPMPEAGGDPWLLLIHGLFPTLKRRSGRCGRPSSGRRSSTGTRTGSSPSSIRHFP